MNPNITIHHQGSIREALEKIEASKLKALICVDDENTLLGSLVDGDIRRGLLKGASLDDSVASIMNSEPQYLTNSASKQDIDNMISARIKVLPIVDEHNKVVDFHTFKEKYESFYIKNRNISILGMGYVGLTLGLILADAGFNVVGLDINEGLIEDLKEKKEPFFEEGLKRYLDKHSGNRIRYTTQPEEALGDVYIITVGTPLLPEIKKPNINHITKAATSIGSQLKRGDLVILRSTVPTGCSRNVVLPALEKQSGLKCGEDFFLAFAPERTAEGVALRELRKNPQIIGAFDNASYEVTSRIFESITHTVINVGSLEAAETCKLIDNTYRDHIFAYANNMARFAERAGLNLHHLVDAVNFGYTRNHVPRPSPGVGGPCLSKDPYILMEVFSEHGLDGDLIHAARKVNESGPHQIRAKLEKLLGSVGKPLQEAKITLVGMAFKGFPETSDLRDSTSVWFLDQMRDCNNLQAYDPVCTDEELASLEVKPVGMEEAFDGADAVVLLNNHKSYRKWNLSKLFSTMNKPAVFIDTWNNFNPVDMKQHAGILYGGLGND
jgi:nucleotide sugar dehydrogenase